MPKPKSKHVDEIDVAIADEQTAHPVNQHLCERIADVVRVIANDYGCHRGEISIAVLDDAAIQVFNRQYLNHDWPTDVITFPLEDEPDRIEGEILVSRETADRESTEQAWTADDELVLYVIHGMLHLMGLDDTNETSTAEMRKMEREYLLRFGVPHADKHA